MARKKGFHDALVFVDTNILLDLYGFESGTSRKEFLDTIRENLNSLILTEQVEMEFKKNRQKVLKKWLDDAKDPIACKPPAYLSNRREAGQLARNVESSKKATRSIRALVKRDVTDPQRDEVLKSLSRLFKHDGPLVLGRHQTKELRKEIRELARERFSIGYPPRKVGDTSMGDAVNWEWMIRCASQAKKSLIVVSRDSDYGITLDGKSHINDWLSQEFGERVGSTKSVLLTSRLSEAFKLIAKKVSKEAEKEEARVVKTALEDERSQALTSKFFVRRLLDLQTLSHQPSSAFLQAIIEGQAKQDLA